MNKTNGILIAVLALGAPLAARAQHMGHEQMSHEGAASASAEGGHAQAAPTAKNGAARTIEMAVTSDGFVPAEVKVKKGEKVRLAITRKTDKTCATEIVVKDYGIHQPLPLGKTVYVDLTPKSTGKIRYACGMDMISGELVVE